MTQPVNHHTSRWPVSRLPISNTTPLVFREGETLLQMIYRLSEYVTEQLHPSLRETVEHIVEEMEHIIADSHGRYVEGIQDFQRIHDAFMEDVNSTLLALNDNAVSDLADDPGTVLGGTLRELFATTEQHETLETRVFERSVTPQQFGAVADWDGTQGTDSAPAFQAAIDAAGDGGTVYVPAGDYYLAETLYITRSITFTTGGGGHVVAGGGGTRLMFAPGVTGIQVGTSEPPRPAHWKIGPLYLRSLSDTPGDDVGILVRGGRGVFEHTCVEYFGSHGFHIYAGADTGGGNGNGNVFLMPRAYGNHGDGIRLEGTDSNSCVMMRPTVVANHGWGINLHRSAMNKIIAPHADQQYYDAPGAFRDRGNSNNWDWVYSEGRAPFLIESQSSHGFLTMSLYGQPELQTNGSGHVSWRIMGIDNFFQNNLRVSSIDESSQWTIEPNRVANGSLALAQGGHLGDLVWVVRPDLNRIQHYTDLYPREHAGADLGSNLVRWNNVYGEMLSGHEVRVGALRLRQNEGQLELSSNSGQSWRRIVTE